jgi:hypothetical protein
VSMQLHVSASCMALAPVSGGQASPRPCTTFRPQLRQNTAPSCLPTTSRRNADKIEKSFPLLLSQPSRTSIVALLDANCGYIYIFSTYPNPLALQEPANKSSFRKFKIRFPKIGCCSSAAKATPHFERVRILPDAREVATS